MTSIVEKELERQRLYTEILTDLTDHLSNVKGFRTESVSTLLLRIIFSEVRYRPIEYQGDPIFNDGPLCPETIESIIEDIKYKDTSVDPDPIIEWINMRMNKAYLELQTFDRVDAKVKYKKGKIYYEGKVLDEINNLAKDYPDHLDYVFATILRYTYIGIVRHGASRNYRGMGYRRDEAVECFANPINRYFDKYCSAFPDIETKLGSMGSWYNPSVRKQVEEMGRSKTLRIFLNPPLTESIIKEIYEYVLGLEGTNLTINSTMPGWKDLHLLYNDDLRSLPGFKYYRECEPGTINFVNLFYKRNNLRPNQNTVVEWEVEIRT